MADHVSERIDVSDLTPDEHERFVFLLRSEEIGHRFHRGIAFVPRDRIADVDRVLVEVRDVGPSLRHDAALVMERSAAESDDSGPVVAGPTRRAIAYAIDGIATTVVALLILGTTAAFDLPATTDLALGIAAFVVLIRPIARTGRTLGAALAGLRVVRLDDGGVPGWLASTTRCIVPLVPYGIARGVAARDVTDAVELWVQLAAFVGGWVVYLWVFTNDWNQGLHDRASDTVVVVQPLPPDHPLRGAARRSTQGGMFGTHGE